MDTNSYIVFLLLGVVLVGVDGQIIYRSGRRYLEESHGATEASASMTRLVTALFHLTVLGLLALITTIDFGGDNPTEAVIVRLGVVLLMLAIAHGITIGVLTKVRARQKREGLAEELAEIRRDNARHNHQSPDTAELRTPATHETPRSDAT